MKNKNKSKFKNMILNLLLPICIFSFIAWNMGFIQTPSMTSNKIYKTYLNNDKTIDLSTATDFDWDKVYIFKPYTSKKEISEKLRQNWNKRSSISNNDRVVLLVFMKNNKIVKNVDFPKNKIDFSVYYNENGYTRKESVFKIKTSI